MRRACLFFLGLSLIAGCAGGDRLNGGGSSFVYPIMLKWSRVYAAERGVEVDYQSTGSGNGVLQMTVGTIDFGATDFPLTAEQNRKANDLGGPIVHIPLVLGAVVPVYNLPGLGSGARLQFSGAVLSGIYLGTVTHWNDPQLQAINPGIPLPNQEILVVSRSDPSGTTAVFADYLSRVSGPLWAERKMGSAGTSTRWPVGESQKGNEGVAGLVRRVPGSIGYVELKYARDVGLDFGAVRNADGEFVVASPATVKAAATRRRSVADGDALTFSLTNVPGADSYPISGAVWAVYYERLTARRLNELTEFFLWATDPAGGQRFAEMFEYASLPDDLVQSARARMRAVVAGSRP